MVTLRIMNLGKRCIKVSDSALQEIFMDLYTKSVKDNEEDFTTLYWII